VSKFWNGFSAFQKLPPASRIDMMSSEGKSDNFQNVENPFYLDISDCLRRLYYIYLT
jgi:hypothetical protein